MLSWQNLSEAVKPTLLSVLLLLPCIIFQEVFRALCQSTHHFLRLEGTNWDKFLWMFDTSYSWAKYAHEKSKHKSATTNYRTLFSDLVICKLCSLVSLWELFFELSFFLRYFRHEAVVVSMQPRRCEWSYGKSTLPTHGTKSFAELGGDWCGQWWWWQWQWWELMATMMMVMWDNIGLNCFDGDDSYDVCI